ncbi:cell wall-binding repeat-containing protein [Fictibacillus halophilus]|uniref:cell wall-binding repeat-containing protein n=1 Tax=Fictibacillus halophilus TaxID=1610490 RepID=UPI001CFB5C3C|nr:cell wall-binding repeat-containing protein [Fictibacillus halophilus]
MRKNIKILMVITLLFGIFTYGFSGVSNVQALSKDIAHLEEVPTGYTGIYSVEDLNNIRNNLSGNYILMDNIDLTADLAEGGKYFNNGIGWEPIGDAAMPFIGTLDGNCYKISGLKINFTSDQIIYAGLIGYAKNASIINLGVESNGIFAENTSLDAETADVYAGGILGFGYNVTITNSYNKGNITAQSVFEGYAGGVAGFVDTDYKSFSIISNTYNEGDVAAKTAAGGITGKSNRTNFSDVHNTGTLTAKTTSYAGGIVGSLNSDSSISNAYNTGNIQFGTTGGGIAGYSYKGTITESYNTGELSSESSSSKGGGIVGSASSSTISDSYNMGEIHSAAQYSRGGGIAGTLSANSTISGSYNTADITEDGSVGGIVGELYSSVISQTFNTGTLSGSFAGGINGYSSGGTVLNSFNIGSVNGKYDSGGIAGNSSNTIIKNTYNIGNLPAKYYYASTRGGIAGEFDGSIENSYFFDKVQDGVGEGIQTGTIKKTFEQMKELSSFEGFDFDNTWRFDADSSFHFPLLKENMDPQTEQNLYITMTSLPKKIDYDLGEPLDLTGSMLTVRTNHGNQFDVAVTNDMVTGYYPNQKGIQQLKVSYDGLFTYFNVKVTPIYTVTFKDYDGTVLKTESVLEGESATAPGNPERAGHTFTGWSASSSNMKSDLIIHAQYQINSYMVTFMDGDAVLYSEGYNSDASVTRPKDPIKQGYTFIDWYTDRELQKKYAFNSTLTKDINLYARFVKNPNEPQNVSVVSTGFDKLKMKWYPAENVDGYEIQQSTSQTGPYNHFYGADSQSEGYDFNWLEPGKTYYYKVRSYRIVDNVHVYSAFTPVTNGTPGVLSIKAVPAGYGKVELNWNMVERASGYEIYRAASSNGNYQKVSTKTDDSTLTFTDSNLSTDLTYYYKVRAYQMVNAEGQKVFGPFSNSLGARTTQFPRFGGSDRYAVQEQFNLGIPDHSLDYVIVTSGLKFPDALSSGVLNNKLNSTTLLVQDRDSIVQSKINEAKRLLKPSGRVLIVGGPGTVSTKIENEFRKYFQVERVGGNDRISVSINVAQRVNANPSEIFLTYGLVFSDSLSIVPYATKANIPIVLQYGNGLNTQVKQYLKSHPSVKKVTIVSGTGVIPVSIEKELRSLGVTTVERVAGKDRFDTSLLIAKKYFPHATEVALSNGLVFADALSGSRFAYKKNMPIILVRNNSAIEATSQFVTGLDPRNIHLYGGPGTISDSIKNYFK